jgi:IS30 family transposase
MHRNFVKSTPFSMVSRANKTSRKEFSESTVNTIWQFHLYGVSGAAIGRHLGVPKSTVHYNIRRLRKQPQHVYTKALAYRASSKA